MKLFKSLLLGSAAGLIAVSGASAADLGVKKPAPVEYVKVCSAHGAGFFYIPGSDVCMQISGRVRAEYLYATPYTRGEDTSSFRGHGRINVDVRQTTQYGLLRAFVRMEQYADDSRYGGIHPLSQRGVNGFAAGITGNTNTIWGAANQGDILNKAFIQFYTGTAGFFTAGRSVSFFDFYANNDNYSRLIGSDRDNVNLFAYTATFGGGFSATLSVEDQYARRLGAGVGAYAAVAPYSAVAYAGQALPDIVGNLRVDQAWGSAQLSGAIHQIRTSNFAAAGANAPLVGTSYGWAVQGGVKINLPMIAAGDTLWLQAAYGQGANDFVGVSRAARDGALFSALRPGGGEVVDGYVNNLGSLKKATSWSVVGSFVHNFTPSVQAAVYGGYGVVNYSGTLASSGFNDFKVWQVGGRINWIPVRNFTIGSELMYNVYDPSGRVATTSVPLLIPTKGKYDSVTARLRFQRDF